MISFFEELRRRKVCRVAAWIVIQVTATVSAGKSSRSNQYTAPKNFSRRAGLSTDALVVYPGPGRCSSRDRGKPQRFGEARLARFDLRRPRPERTGAGRPACPRSFSRNRRSRSTGRSWSSSWREFMRLTATAKGDRPLGAFAQDPGGDNGQRTASRSDVGRPAQGSAIQAPGGAFEVEEALCAE